VDCGVEASASLRDDCPPPVIERFGRLSSAEVLGFGLRAHRMNGAYSCVLPWLASICARVSRERPSFQSRSWN